MDFKDLFKELKSEYISVYSLKEDKILYDKQGDFEIYPASITKVMNALTAIKYASLDLECVVGEEQDVMWRSPDPSLAHLKKGEHFKLGDLLFASLLPSGNDAAYAIGYNVINSIDCYKEKSVIEKCEIFADLMNQYAKELGCKNTHFVTLDGNDYVDKKVVHHVTSTNDLCLIFIEALNHPEIVEVISSYEKVINANGKEYKFINGNDLINPNSEHYNSNVIGGKTGMTCPAGYCLGSVGYDYITDDCYVVICCYSYVNQNKYIDSNKIYRALMNKSFESKRLEFRAIDKNDKEDLREIVKNSKVTEPAGFKKIEDEKEFSEFYAALTLGGCGIGVRYNNKCIGYVHVNKYEIDEDDYPIIKDKKVCEIGFLIDEKYWGIGLGKEMVERVTEYLHEYFDVIFAEYFVENERSKKTLEGLGYKYLSNYKYEFEKLGLIKELGCTYHIKK